MPRLMRSVTIAVAMFSRGVLVSARVITYTEVIHIRDADGAVKTLMLAICVVIVWVFVFLLAGITYYLRARRHRIEEAEAAPAAHPPIELVDLAQVLAADTDTESSTDVEHASETDAEHAPETHAEHASASQAGNEAASGSDNEPSSSHEIESQAPEYLSENLPDPRSLNELTMALSSNPPRQTDLDAAASGSHAPDRGQAEHPAPEESEEVEQLARPQTARGHHDDPPPEYVARPDLTHHAPSRRHGMLFDDGFEDPRRSLIGSMDHETYLPPSGRNLETIPGLITQLHSRFRAPSTSAELLAQSNTIQEETEEDLAAALSDQAEVAQDYMHEHSPATSEFAQGDDVTQETTHEGTDAAKDHDHEDDDDSSSSSDEEDNDMGDDHDHEQTGPSDDQPPAGQAQPIHESTSHQEGAAHEDGNYSEGTSHNTQGSHGASHRGGYTRSRHDSFVQEDDASITGDEEEYCPGGVPGELATEEEAQRVLESRGDFKWEDHEYDPSDPRFDVEGTVEKISQERARMRELTRQALTGEGSGSRCGSGSTLVEQRRSTYLTASQCDAIMNRAFTHASLVPSPLRIKKRVERSAQGTSATTERALTPATAVAVTGDLITDGKPFIPESPTVGDLAFEVDVRIGRPGSFVSSSPAKMNSPSPQVSPWCADPSLAIIAEARREQERAEWIAEAIKLLHDRTKATGEVLTEEQINQRASYMWEHSSQYALPSTAYLKRPKTTSPADTLVASTDTSAVPSQFLVKPAASSIITSAWASDSTLSPSPITPATAVIKSTTKLAPVSNDTTVRAKAQESAIPAPEQSVEAFVFPRSVPGGSARGRYHNRHVSQGGSRAAESAKYRRRSDGGYLVHQRPHSTSYSGTSREVAHHRPSPARNRYASKRGVGHLRSHAVSKLPVLQNRNSPKPFSNSLHALNASACRSSGTKAPIDRYISPEQSQQPEELPRGVVQPQDPMTMQIQRRSRSGPPRPPQPHRPDQLPNGPVHPDLLAPPVGSFRPLANHGHIHDEYRRIGGFFRSPATRTRRPPHLNLVPTTNREVKAHDPAESLYMSTQAPEPAFPSSQVLPLAASDSSDTLVTSPISPRSRFPRVRRSTRVNGSPRVRGPCPAYPWVQSSSSRLPVYRLDQASNRFVNYSDLGNNGAAANNDENTNAASTNN